MEYDRISIHQKSNMKLMCIEMVLKIHHYKTQERLTMRSWKKPIVIEIAVGMEINCYVCAEL